MNMVTHLRFSTRLVPIFIFLLIIFIGSGSFLTPEDTVHAVSSPTTRTVIAEVLEVEGDFHIVRGERGEIRIEVTPNTQVSEEFIYGDRIKALLLPNDVALSITRAAPEELIGMIDNEPSDPAPPPTSEDNPQASEENLKITSPLYKAYQVPKIRVVIANILMVDDSFYIIRSEQGEIQIEITPETTLSEDFKFDDRIKARITPANKALTVTRAGKNEPTGIVEEVSSEFKAPIPAVPPTQTSAPIPAETESSQPLVSEAPATRLIIADVLMVEGDFYILRGERGEIQIEVTPETTVSESFDYGDRIKAEVLPNDKALTIERAGPNDPVGMATP